eukprot:scaffold70332_cov38-Prasinocladus_malaysianus.AAC.2
MSDDEKPPAENPPKIKAALSSMTTIHLHPFAGHHLKGPGVVQDCPSGLATIYDEHVALRHEEAGGVVASWDNTVGQELPGRRREVEPPHVAEGKARPLAAEDVKAVIKDKAAVALAGWGRGSARGNVDGLPLAVRRPGHGQIIVQDPCRGLQAVDNLGDIYLVPHGHGHVEARHVLVVDAPSGGQKDAVEGDGPGGLDDLAVDPDCHPALRGGGDLELAP